MTQRPLKYDDPIKAKYLGSNEWIEKGSIHEVRISKPSDDKLYFMLKLYPLDILPIRMHAYLSESELRKDWEIL